MHSAEIGSKMPYFVHIRAIHLTVSTKSVLAGTIPRITGPDPFRATLSPADPLMRYAPLINPTLSGRE
jgi:hypothetical protein